MRKRNRSVVIARIIEVERFVLDPALFLVFLFFVYAVGFSQMSADMQKTPSVIAFLDRAP